MAATTANLQSFIVDGVQRLSFDACLLFRVFTLVWEQVGLDVGVGETVAVGSCQSSCFVHMNQQLPSFILHTKQHLSSDVIVSLPLTCFTVHASHAAQAPDTAIMLQTKTGGELGGGQLSWRRSKCGGCRLRIRGRGLWF